MTTYPHRDAPHYVYRCYDIEDRLLYVGCTYNPPARMSQHAKRSAWYGEVARVRFLVFPNKERGNDAERDAIIAERPIHNKTHRYWSPVTPEALAARKQRLALLRGGAA